MYILVRVVNLICFLTIHRHLGDYEKSTENLKAALGERKHLESLDVADIQKEFSATLFCCGEYMESR